MYRGTYCNKPTECNHGNWIKIKKAKVVFWQVLISYTEKWILKDFGLRSRFDLYLDQKQKQKQKEEVAFGFAGMYVSVLAV